MFWSGQHWSQPNICFTVSLMFCFGGTSAPTLEKCIMLIGRHVSCDFDACEKKPAEPTVIGCVSSKIGYIFCWQICQWIVWRISDGNSPQWRFSKMFVAKPWFGNAMCGVPALIYNNKKRIRKNALFKPWKDREFRTHTFNFSRWWCQSRKNMNNSK